MYDKRGVFISTYFNQSVHQAISVWGPQAQSKAGKGIVPLPWNPSREQVYMGKSKAINISLTEKNQSPQGESTAW